VSTTNQKNLDVHYDLFESDFIPDRTKDMDQTLTNFLDGHVSYVPDEPSPSSSSSSQHSQGQAAKPQEPKTFAKTPADRMLSFQQRKDLMIEQARLKYLDKVKQTKEEEDDAKKGE
jgi:hypothetical protein